VISNAYDVQSSMQYKDIVSRFIWKFLPYGLRGWPTPVSWLEVIKGMSNQTVDCNDCSVS